MFYILDDNQNAVPCDDVQVFAEWFEGYNRVVACDTIACDAVNDVKISTVFLGIDHAPDGMQPVLFETLVFQHDRATDDMRRYATWEQAEQGHKDTVAAYQRKALSIVSST